MNKAKELNWSKQKFNKFELYTLTENEKLLFVTTVFEDIKKYQEKYFSTYQLVNKSSTTSKDFYKEAEKYFNKEIISFSTTNFTFIGTDFQRKVWNALSQIPYGEISTYKDIATKIGAPKAYRAVGSAIGKNPYLIIVPCHRVNGSDNKLHGFRSGLELKQVLQNLEKGN